MVQQPYQTPWSLPADEIADLRDWAQTGLRAGDAILAMSPDQGDAAYRALKQAINGALERLGPTPTAIVSVPELPSRTF